ncbi:hypothetical protein FKP32DRAFT_1616007 [Trametes sanguinea]|nr:hypothetical protein FKP32DRAFT_1616007 [Trametes sanguinea]
MLLPIGAVFLVMSLAQNLGFVPCPLNDVPAAKKAQRATPARRSDAWVRERAAHEAELGEWAEERKAHDEEREDWHKQWEADRKARDTDKEEWRRQREQEELHRLEVLRRSQGVYWTEPSGDAHCHAYGTRTYIAYLRDIPSDLNGREVCDYMPPVVIHGRALSKPDKCERNERGEVVGVWYVDFDEPGCQPHWGWVQSKGCSPGQAGIERYEGRLDGIASGDDWQMMCDTTPATIIGTHFDHPSSCENRVRNSQILSGHWSGMVGIWDYPNASC